MFIIDPENGEAVETPDPATAAAEAEAPEADDVMAAMDKAIEEEAPEPAADEPVPGSNEAADADRAAAEAAAKAAKPDDGKAAEPDKDTEDEINALGLKEKSAARFRELTAEVKALAPIREQLEKAGIKDVTQLPALVRDATDGRDLVKMVSETGASPDQFGMTLDYLSVVAAANRGDRGAGEKAWEMWLSEGKALAANLGKEMPGVHDPLEGHADLQEAIEIGDMTRKHALEVAQARRHQSVVTQHQQQATEQQQAQRVQQQAVQQGIDQLKQWEAGKLADPSYAAIRPALNAEVAKIRQQFPPAQWATATEYAYRAIKASTAAKPAPKPTPGPVRATGPMPTMTPAAFDNPMDALDAGIASANA